MPDTPWKPPEPPPDPAKLGEECFTIVAESLGIDLSHVEEQAIRQLTLYSDRASCLILGSVITRALALAANRALRGSLWDQGNGGSHQ
jgi:hypothetical protein